MSAAMDGAAAAGYEAVTSDRNQHIYTSPLWYAWELGRYFRSTGRPTPTDVRMSRGYSIRSRDLVFSVKGTSTAPIFERLR